MKQYLYAGIVIAIVISFSLMIIPRKAELGLMYKKGRQYDLAKYEFKKQSNDGDLSIKVTIPLMELFLYFGEIDQAIELIERFVKENPKDISAHEILGKLYRDGMMPQKYILNLEKTLLLEPTEKRLRELIALHQTQGKPGRALGFLKTVIKQFPAKSEDYFTLAFLQARNGNLSEAVQTLKMFEEENPQSVSIDIKELEIHLLLDLGQFEKGREKASDWLEKNFSYSSLTRLVQLFRSKKQNSSALYLMKTFDGLLKETVQERPQPRNPKIKKIPSKGPLVAKAKDSPNETLVKLLREEYIDLQFQSFTKKEALTKMHELFDREKLPDSLRQEYIDLALELKEHALLFDMALKRAPENRGKDLLLVLAEVTLSAGTDDSMKKVLEKLGDEFLSARPLLGARLMDHLNDREATFRWLKVVEAKSNLTLDQQIELVHFYNKLGVPERAQYKNVALAKMNELSNREKLSDSLRNEYIDLALELKEYPLLFKLVLEASPENMGKDVLLNLSELTLNADVGDSMEKVLERFGDEFLSTRPFLGARLMNHLKNRESTFYWLEKFESRPGLTLNQQIELIHFYDKIGVLERAKTKLDINGLKLLITQKLAEPELLISHKKDLVNVLIRFDILKSVLPHLKILAQTEGRDWEFTYEKTLLRLNHTTQLVNFWGDQIRSNGLTLEEKRNIIFQLLEKNLKADAEKFLKILAKNASPKSPDVLHLLFLWGPSVTAESQKWLISQAKASKGKDLVGWMKHLVQVGAAKEAVAIVKTRDLSNKALFDAFLQALQVLENKELIMTEIEEKLVTEKNAGTLFRYGKLAEDLGLYETAVLAYEKILDEQPGDEKIIKKLGFVYYQQKKWAETEFYLENYLDKGSDDWKTTFYFAESLFSQGKTSKAETYYLQVLEKTRTNANKPLDLNLARATCLHRLGKKTEALLAYKNLLKKNPDNEKFRAHFIGALMDFREFDQAQALLKSP